MNVQLRIISLLISTLVFQELFAQIGGTIPSTQRVDWSNVGVKNFLNVYDTLIDVTQNGTNSIFPNDGVDDINKLQIQLNNRNRNKLTIFYFPSGTYNFSATIILDGNVVLHGAGSDQTQFSFTNSDPNKNCIQVHGSGVGSPVDINATSAVKGSKIILLNSALNVNQNDLIDIYATDNYPDWSSAGFNPHDKIGQIDRVASSNSGNTSSISLEDELRLDYTYDYVRSTTSTFPLKVKRISNPVHHVGIENVYINHPSSDMSTMNYNISFQYARDCWVYGVESYNPSRAHINIAYSNSIEVKGCYFHHAKFYGTGGHGYGVSINSRSSNCLVENNVFSSLRHAMIMQYGANGNVFGFNYSQDIEVGNSGDKDDADASFHGNFTFSNLFEGNVNEFYSGDNQHGINGPFNTIFRNLSTRESSWELFGTPDGGVVIQSIRYTSAVSQKFSCICFCS